MHNLDLECAELGRNLAKDANEKILTASLSVLEEQGVYACFLFLTAGGGNDGTKISEKCAKFLRRVPESAPLLTDGDMFDALKTLAQDLDKLLFAKDLLRQAFVYGRYHAKGSRELA